MQLNVKSRQLGTVANAFVFRQSKETVSDVGNSKTVRFCIPLHEPLVLIAESRRHNFLYYVIVLPCVVRLYVEIIHEL